MWRQAQAVIAILLLPLMAAAENSKPPQPTAPEIAVEKKNTAEEYPLILSSNLKGWDYFFFLLVAQGIEPEYLRGIIRDPRLPEATTVSFKVRPREPEQIYRGLNTRANRLNAQAFYLEHRESFKRAAREFQLDPWMILALLQIETACGKNTGKELVFYRLARLSSANAPSNLAESYRINQKSWRMLSFETLRARGWFLQDLFLKHAVALLELAKSEKMHPLDFIGSSAGALGMPQFLPGNIQKFGVDADGNGKIDLFTPEDAIFSVGRFLKAHGWDESKPMSIEEKQEVLRNYNRSEPYVRTALAMAGDLRSELELANE